MPDAVVMRPAAPDDALCIGMLATQVFLDTYATDGLHIDLAREALAVYSPRAFETRLADPTTHIVLAEVRQHLVGFAELRLAQPCPVPAAGVATATGMAGVTGVTGVMGVRGVTGVTGVTGAGAAEIVRLYVQRRFQRTGLGRRLADRAEGVALAHGADTVWLTAWSGNVAALAFYPAIGYADVGATTHVIEGQAYDNRVFAKRLGRAGSRATVQ
jgi:ribosomal protein S18 acetylase RimI-like enzyme